MPRPDPPPLTRGVAIRSAGFGLAVVLGVIAVWLISTSTTPKSLQLGVLAGLWGAILAAFTAFGSRRHHDEPDAAAEHGAELALRSSGELDRADEAAARRAYEARLEHMLRREINATMTREVASLRSEIAQLRQDLLEKVGGQLRLERIETTRLIGSDLEALQHEVRQLKQASTTGSLEIALGRLSGAELGHTRSVVEADVHTLERMDAPVRPAREQGETVTRIERVTHRPAQPPVESREPSAPASAQPAAQRAPVTPAPPQPAPPPAPAAQRVAGQPAASGRVSPPANGAPHVPQKPPAQAQESRPQQPAAQQPAAQQPARQAPPTSQQPAGQSPPPPPPARPAAPPPPPPPPPPIAVVPARDEDPFASLPRIRPFTDFELDPIESTPPPPRPEREPAPAEGPRYTGRRRAADEIEAEKAAQAEAEAQAQAETEAEPEAGRHSDGAEPETPASRRHRRADESGSGEDLLARLLAREGVQR